MLSFLQNDRSVLWLSTAFYILAFAYAMVSLLLKKEHRIVIFYALLTSGFAIHSFALYNRGIADQAFPLNNTFEILMVISWSAVMLEFTIRPAFRLRLLGFFTSALTSLLGVCALSIPNWDAPITITTKTANPWIGFHAALAVFSYGVFALLATTAIMYLIQHYALRKIQSGGLFQRLPSVSQLDTINRRLLLVGVSILTVSIAIGFANHLRIQGNVSMEKLLIATTVWVAYVFIHQLRSRKVLIASHFAWTCLIMFLFALLSLHFITAKKSSTTQPMPSESHPIINLISQ